MRIMIEKIHSYGKIKILLILQNIEHCKTLLFINNKIKNKIIIIIKIIFNKI